MRIREFFARLFERKESATTRAVIVGQPGGSWTQADLEKIAREGFESNVVVNACINGIADAVAGIDWFLEAPDGSEVPNQETHPIMLLWNRPNPTMSGSTFRRRVTIFY